MINQQNAAPPQNRVAPSDSAPSPGFDPRYLWLGIAALVFLAGTWLALTQDPRPDPFQPVQRLSTDWWRYPVERNAFKRQLAIDASIHAIHADKDGRHLWGVGSRGLIVHSKDGGRTWIRQTFVPSSEPSGGDFDSPNAQLNPMTKFNARAAKAQENAPLTQPATDGTPDLSGMFFLPDARTGWAVGDAGTILHTSDAGATWLPQESGTRAGLNSVAFTDARTGWAVGEEGTILHTSDAGASWVRRGSITRAPLNSVAFTDARTGWAVGRAGTILHTSDAGQTWVTQESRTSTWLNSIAFTDARTGWAVGYFGTILHTSDAGASWVPQVSGTSARLTSVAFTDTRTGWAVGLDGTILHTGDAGASWVAQVSPTSTWLSSVAFTDARTGWAVGGNGTILHTSDAGASWVAQVNTTITRLASVAFTGARTGWTVGYDGTILHTGDAGASWVVQVSRTNAWLNSVAFTSARTGWAVGSFGTILHTSNAGASWVPQDSRTSAWLTSVAFANARTGWAVGYDGTILHTSDAGASWVAQVSPKIIRLNSVAFTDALTGWAVGDAGTILHTSDAGASWVAQVSRTNAWLSSVAFTDARTGWAVGRGGTILHTDDAGVSWVAQVSRSSAWLNSVAFSDARTGWAVGSDGTILHTSDAGASWVAQVSATSALLHSVAFTDARTGWAMGRPVTILHTSDAGETWQGIEQPGAASLVTYARYPAPWWYLALLAGFGFLGLALRPPMPKVRTMASVADLALSDRPLEVGDRDLLGFSAIALGLSNFLRNSATEPPLTLAITGDWGSGKSSLMNLLREDLRKRGFRPVWFNVWHQPKDANLLAALVSTIRMQALPPLISVEGLRFRGQLVWLRTRERLLWVAPMVFLAAYLVTYFGMDPSRLRSAIEWLPLVAKAFGDDDQAAEKLLGGVQSLAFLATILVPVITLWRGLRAFGVNPGTLASSAVGNLRLAGDKSRFLNDYARQFQDVANALRPRTLTLFIDDLDRCPPERVREALESVNYLVSSGHCYVVLGMARERVEACVGLAFKDVAQELVNLARFGGESHPAAPDPTKDEAHRQRRNYARDYLKKLVNIEVPVPQPDEREAKGLVGALSDDTSSPTPEPTWRVLHRAGKRFWPLFILVACVLAGWWYAAQTPDVMAPVSAPHEQLPAPPSVSVPGRSPGPGVTPDYDKINETGEANFVPGQTAPVPMSVWLLPLLVLLLATATIFIRRPHVVERDSRNFRTSLATWLPLVAARQNTPREVKRFVNRVRLIAMRQRAEGQNDEQLDEPMLVALGALHHVNESLLDAPPNIGTGAAVEASLIKAGHAWAHRITKPLEDALAAHSKLASWPPSSDQLLQFRGLVGGARLD